jgi:predicted nucleic acid-binding protein
VKVLFDTTMFVASFVEHHPHHARAFPWMKRAKAREFELLVSSHTLAELYAVLTSLPVAPRITPGIACKLIEENIEPIGTIAVLSPTDHSSTIRNMRDMGLAGGLVYDALVLSAAVASGVDKLLTLNASDLKRIRPEWSDRIIEP